MKANFDRNDLDHDGYIDRSEMEQLAQRLARGKPSIQLGSARQGDLRQ